MSDPIFAAAHAYLDDQLTITGDWDERQYITLELSDGHNDPDPVEAALTSSQARDLAFGLLALAEHADQRARGDA